MTAEIRETVTWFIGFLGGLTAGAGFVQWWFKRKVTEGRK